MREATLDGITKLLDQPDPSINDNQKVVRWNVTPTLDVVVQRDASDDQGVVWVTDLPAPPHPDFSELYQSAKGLHSATFHKCPTMIEGKPVRRIIIREKSQLSEAIRYLMRLRGTKPNALAKKDSQAMSVLKGFLGTLKHADLIPPVGTVIAFAADKAEGLLDLIEKRKADRKAANVEILLQTFSAQHRVADERLESLEEKLQGEGLADSFEDAIAAALEEDEVEKLPIYGAILGWIARGVDKQQHEYRRPHPVRIRMLTRAVQELSYLELTAMFQLVEQHGGRPLVHPFMDENFFWRRTAAVNIAQGGGVKMNSGATEVGEFLAELCKPLNLKPVPGTRQQ